MCKECNIKIALKAYEAGYRDGHDAGALEGMLGLTGLGDLFSGTGLEGMFEDADDADGEGEIIEITPDTTKEDFIAQLPDDMPDDLKKLIAELTLILLSAFPSSPDGDVGQENGEEEPAGDEPADAVTESESV